MNIVTIVMTCPRPVPTLARTLASLHQAGFSNIHVQEDAMRQGHFYAYMAALEMVFSIEADAYFICEDDIVVWRGLHDYLQKTLWPGPENKVALCSPYCASSYRPPYVYGRFGWSARLSHLGRCLSGSQSFVFPPAAIEAILTEVAPIEAPHNADWEIGRWAKDTKRKSWCHSPSLVQHVGLGNSALGDDGITEGRYAADFIGEEGIFRYARATDPGTKPDSKASADAAG